MKELKRQLENIIEEIDRTKKDKYFTKNMSITPNFSRGDEFAKK